MGLTRVSIKTFPQQSFQFIPLSSMSSVSDQPFGEDETRQGILYSDRVIGVGSINRVLYARQQWEKEHDEQVDFIVGLEVGFGSGFEMQGGVKKDEMSIDFEKKESSLSVFAWMAILQPSTNRWGMICV